MNLVNAFTQTVLRKQRSDSPISVNGPGMASNVRMRKASILLQKSRGCLLSNIYIKITRRVPSEKMVQRQGIFAAGPPKRAHSGLEWAHLSLPCSQTLHRPTHPFCVPFRPCMGPLAR